MDAQDVKVFASKQSIKERRLQNIVIPGVELTGYGPFFELAQNADHLISV
jgi:hypothetical protein